MDMDIYGNLWTCPPPIVWSEVCLLLIYVNLIVLVLSCKIHVVNIISLDVSIVFKSSEVILKLLSYKF